MNRRHLKRLQRKEARGRPRPHETWFSLAVLLAFIVVAYFAAPDFVPTFFQRLAGLVNAMLAMLVAMFAVREFGGRFNKLRLPVVGQIRTSRLAGAAAFLVVCAWWLSPWAPIQPVSL